MLYDKYAPLTFDPKINRGHPLVMTNLHVKYEHSVTKSAETIWSTDRPTNRLTLAKQYTPSSSKGA